MKSPKYVVLAFVVIGLILTSSCDLLKKPQGSLKKEAMIKEESSAIETAKREDFGCFYSCKYFPEGFPRQMCEDWKAGKEVYWPDDCTTMQYEPCIRLCEYEKNSTKKTTPIPANMPSYDISFPQSQEDFLFHTRAPACVYPNKEYNAQLVYARPSDGKDRYQEMSQTLRKWIANANGIVNNEAERFGITADIKIACNGNEISVINIVLPKSSSELNTHNGKTTEAIAASMKELGYKDSKTKYIVYYDSSADGCEGGKEVCSGQFSAKSQDDRLSEDNIYNSGPDYSVLYDGGFSMIPQRYHNEIDMMAPIIMLHEYTHTLGAVQSSSPHSSKDDSDTAGHCNDEPPQEKGGNDIMCRSDKTDTVFDDTCKESGFAMHYDCNNDDYFNPKPEPGSYLATHWNLGSPLNRYIKFG